MPLINRNRIIILLTILIGSVLALSGFNYFLGSSEKKETQPLSKTSTLTQEELKNIKCQAGLQAPSVDSRACSFKEIAAAEIERRKLCSKDDAREALEISCNPAFSPEGMNFAQNPSPGPLTSPRTSPTASGLTGSGGQQPNQASGSAVVSKCTPKNLASSERFQLSKSLACSTMMQFAADEFFKDPRPGCKTKEEALAVVKRACNGDVSDTPMASSSASLTIQTIDPANPLANLINCTSIASSSADLVRSQPILCSSPDSLSKDYPECSKEIVQVVTPVCLGDNKPGGSTSLSGVTPGNPPEALTGLALECLAAKKSVETDIKVCQFKDLSAQELSNRNLCTKDSAKAALDQLCTGQSAASPSGAVFCGGAIVAKNTQFQSQKDLACGVGRSVAIKTIMDKTGSPCKTEADAGRALDEACGKIPYASAPVSPGGSTGQDCTSIVNNLAGILSNNRALCSSAGSASTEYSQCKDEILAKVTPICVGSEQTSPTVSGTAECTAFAESLYATVRANTSLCSSPVPDQYKSCTDTIVTTLKPICGSSSVPSASGAQCNGATVASDSQFQQSRELACGVGKSVAIKTIMGRSGSPCKTESEATAALNEACNLSTTPPAGTQPPSSARKICNGELVASNADFQQNKALACSSYQAVAIQKILSTPGTPCITEAAAKTALEQACSGNIGTPTSSPTASVAAGASTVPATSSSPSPAAGGPDKCDCAVIAANPEFQQSKTAACGNRDIASEQIASKSNGSCTKAAARSALDKICSNQCVASTSPSPSASTIASIASPSPSPASSASPSAADPNKCTCGAIAANPEFQQNKTAACGNRDIAAEQIASKSGGACSKAAARSGLNKICDNQCAENPDPTVIVQTPNGPVPLFGIQGGGSSNDPEKVYDSKCTCTAISANPEFQKNSGAACQFKNVAIPRIVESSNGNCDTQTAAAELDKICSNQCVDTAGNKVEVQSTGSACTCANIAENPEFQKSGGMACQFKGAAVEKIVESSKGVCDENTASAQLDAICAGQCVGNDGNLIPAPQGGGFLDTIMDVVENIPIIGDIVGMIGGGGGGGDDDGFNIGEIIGDVVETVGGFIGGFF